MNDVIEMLERAYGDIDYVIMRKCEYGVLNNARDEIRTAIKTLRDLNSEKVCEQDDH
jgi:hypothetical protein